MKNSFIIHTLGFSPRTLNALESWGISTVWQLQNKKIEDLRKLKWFWNKAEREVKDYINNL